MAKRPGVLGEAAKALARDGIGVMGFSLESGESVKTASFAIQDVDQALQALDGVGIGRRVREVLVLPAPADTDGVERLGERLAGAEVSVETGFLVPDAPRRAQLALSVDDPHRARRALGQAPVSGVQ
jgi:hypothetical protein